MAINQNHPFEELNGIKCGIAEKNAGQERVSFLKSLLEQNGYEVVVVPSPPPKAPAAPAAGSEQGEVSSEQPVVPLPPETFTIGVTDYTFNTTNAIFGRLLRTPDGHVVTRDYWLQISPVALDDVPYYAEMQR